MKAHRLELKRRIAIQKRTIAELDAHTRLEHLDLVKLQKLSLRKLFITVLGDMEERLEKERQEYLFAVLEGQAAKRSLKAMLYEQKILNRKLNELKGIEKKVERLLKRAEIKALIKDSKTAKHVKSINAEILQIHSMVGEIKEANKAGDVAKKWLHELGDSISKFESWGGNLVLSQSYHGKGRNSSYLKKREVDRSKGLIFKCQGALNRFNNELSDFSSELNFDSTDHLEVIHDFLNIFLDNLITDWIVREQIYSSLHAAEMIYDKVSRIQQMLIHEMESMKVKMNELQKKKIQLLLK